MKIYTTLKRLFTLLSLLPLALLSGCESERVTYDGPNYIMFSAQRHDLGVMDSEEWFEIPISATRTEDYDRNVGVELIAARSSAIHGLHYTLEATTVTIPAGKLTAMLRIKGYPEAISVADDLSITLNLVIDDREVFEEYGTETEIHLYKCCPLDMNAFTGYAVLTSTWCMQYMNVESRLVKTHLDEKMENTIVIESMYYDGYDIRITFKNDNRLEPLLEMAEPQVAGDTGEAFGTIYGNGELMMMQTANSGSYYSPCERFLLQYVTLYVEEVGTVGSYANIIEWISDDEAERIMREGF
ncbi:MAG: DUF4984 domain-containing protein [Alistipes sp.]|nr:DUF4984 domain-containing protein [Alistipes sp.]